MTLEELKNLSVSIYNEDTDDQIEYYIDENKCAVGDKAYIYLRAYNDLTEVEIIHIITRMDNAEIYDKLIENKNVLIDGEFEYDADTSAEFITDNNCYLVWFRYTCYQEDKTHESHQTELLS